MESIALLYQAPCNTSLASAVLLLQPWPVVMDSSYLFISIQWMASLHLPRMTNSQQLYPPALHWSKATEEQNRWWCWITATYMSMKQKDIALCFTLISLTIWDRTIFVYLHPYGGKETPLEGSQKLIWPQLKTTEKLHSTIAALSFSSSFIPPKGLLSEDKYTSSIRQECICTALSSIYRHRNG